MSCYYHSNAEGVVHCAKCGVALCRECEQKALIRTDNGTGQAFCRRCGLLAAQEIATLEEKWLKKRAIKLGFMGVFILMGLLSWLFINQGILMMFSWFLVAGCVACIGEDSNPESIKQQIIDAEMAVHHPISSSIGKALVYTLFAPFLFIANIIGYMRTKSQYNKDLANLEQAKIYASEK